MLLIDEVLEDSVNVLRARTAIRPDWLFLTDDGLPAWVGVELMAQTVGCWAGLRRLERKEAVQLGFLLGTRRYECSVSHFKVGWTLEISADLEIVSEQGLAVFSCALWHEGKSLASAHLNVFQPADANAFIQEALK